MEKLYDSAEQEYYLSDDDGQHKLVYAYFGLAIYFGQCLEETFSAMLWTDRIFKKKVKMNQEVNKIIDAIENSKKTMGVFINEVKQSYTLTDEIIEQLDKALNDRNFLVHKYFKINIQKFYSEIGRLEMLKYFCNFCDNSKSLEKDLKIYYKKYTDKLGVTQERVDAIMKDMVEQEKKRAESSSK